MCRRESPAIDLCLQSITLGRDITLNIYILDKDPRLAARYHCDQHVTKMITQGVHLLSTALAFYGQRTFYDSIHMNHLCALWVRETVMNYLWLNQLVHSLNNEYKRRFNRVADHKDVRLLGLHIIPRDFPIGSQTAFVQAIPKEYQKKNPITAYRDYYFYELRELPNGEEMSWKKCRKPKWWIRRENRFLRS